MKPIYKILLLSLLLCIGFIPNTTAASFEPAKTALYLGDSNPGNYSLLQYVLEHKHINTNSNSPAAPYLSDLRSRYGEKTTGITDVQLILRITLEQHNNQIPLSVIDRLLSSS
jgi:hypothetical protein